jgi:hypothetical protein
MLQVQAIRMDGGVWYTVLLTPDAVLEWKEPPPPPPPGGGWGGGGQCAWGAGVKLNFYRGLKN